MDFQEHFAAHFAVDLYHSLNQILWFLRKSWTTSTKSSKASFVLPTELKEFYALYNLLHLNPMKTSALTIASDSLKRKSQKYLEATDF